MDPFYLIESDFGRLGTGFDGDRQYTKSNVIDGIVAGEFGKVVKVFECWEDEKRLSDITEECAKAIADRFYEDREPVPYRVQNFLHDKLGVASTRGLNLAA